MVKVRRARPPPSRWPRVNAVSWSSIAVGTRPDIRQVAGEPVELRRNARRTRNAAARRQDGRAIVELPLSVPVAEEQQWLDVMMARLHRHESRLRDGRSDVALLERACELHATYLTSAQRTVPQPRSVTWVENQDQRWGSCTPQARTIRISTRLQDFPQWVLDYVLLHELAHLGEPGHGPAFHALLATYPRTAEATGYLAGYTAGQAARPAPVRSAENLAGEVDEDGH